MIEARKLKGFCDFHPEQASRREQIISSLRRHASVAGFEEISTPALEYAEVLLGSGGDETDKEVYRFEDHGARKVALRFDLTVPFARYVAENQGTMVFPFKKFQVGEVWRGEKPQKGRYRQFCQADIDVIGADCRTADVEVLSCITKTIHEVLGRSFTIQVGHRQVLSGLIRAKLKGVTEDQEKAILIAIDKLAKIGQEKVIRLINDKTGFDASEVQSFLDLITANGQNGSDLEKIRKDVESLDDGDLRVEFERYCETVLALSSQAEQTHGKVVADLSIARGLGYYTGIVFETTVDDLPSFGSVSSGGRYNELVSRFSKRELAGVGGSIGVDRLVAALEELSPASKDLKDRNGVFIAIGEPEALKTAMDIATQVRAEGILCEVTSKMGKFASQFKYADRKRRAHVITLASEEMATKTITLKNLETGEEKKGIKGVRELLQSL